MTGEGPTPDEIVERLGSLVGDKYRIRTLVGAGGMGAVYQAVNEMTEALVAVKLLLQHQSTSPEAEKRFLQEAKVAAKLNHPHIVQIFDLGQDDDGSWFIVQELLDGEDLEARLARAGGQLDLRRTLQALVPIAAALGAAHKAGVVHRDLKPSNVFLDRRQKHTVPKLIDFGVSKIVDDTPHRRITQQGGTVGTPDFMAPEQALGAEDLGPAVDVWAMGCLMYWCLAGRGPFPGPGMAVLAQMQRDEPDRLSQIAGVPEDVSDAIHGALRRDPADRYPDLAHLIGAILRAPSVHRTAWGQQLIRRFGSDAHDPPKLSRLRLPEKRTQIALGVLAVLLSASALLLAIRDEDAEKPMTTEAEASPASLAAACERWRDAIFEAQEPQGGFRGIPQLPQTGWATAEALVALRAAQQLCGGVEAASLEVGMSALARFEKRRGYGSTRSGEDPIATAWALWALHKAGDEEGVRRARRDLEGTQTADGSFGAGSHYATAVAVLAMTAAPEADSQQEGTDGDASETSLGRAVTFLEQAILEPGLPSIHDVPGLVEMAYLAVHQAPHALGDRTALAVVVSDAVAKHCRLERERCTRASVENESAPIPASEDASSGAYELPWLPWTHAVIPALMSPDAQLPRAQRRKLQTLLDATERALRDDVPRTAHAGTLVAADHLIALRLLPPPPGQAPKVD